MKKKVLQISSIVFILIFINLIFVINTVNADSVAGINCPSSVNVNENFKVSLTLPSNAVAAEAIVTAKFSDGSTSEGKIVYVQGDMAGNKNEVFLKAKATGAATITISNVRISDTNAAYIENGGSKSQTLTVVDPNAQQPTNPTNPTTPTTPPANTTTNTNTTTNNTTVKFTDVNETIYTTEKCNIREKTSTDSNKVGTVEKGTELKRTGVGDNGWSRIEYNGKTCYISSKYVTKEKVEIEFKKPANEKMYAKQSCNLRASWSTSSDKVGYLDAGQEITVVGVADNGWSKIKYNGKEVYIATRLLQTEPVEEEPEEKEPEEPEASTTNSSEELAEIKKDIGVLPEVGNNISVYTYIIFAVMALAMAGYGIYYTNKK